MCSPISFIVPQRGEEFVMNNQWFKPASVVSVEAIDFQTADVLCRELEVLVEEYRFSKSKDVPAAERNKVFSDLAAKVIGKRIKAKKVTVEVVNADSTYNAYAMPPDLAKSSVLIKSYFGLMEQASAGKNAIKRDANAIGWVDLRKVELGGIFQEIPIRLGVYSAVIGNEYMTPAEAVGVIMHEVGHIFTYYEMLSTAISTALVLQDSVSRLMKTNSDEQRVKLVHKLETDYDIRFENANELVTAESTEVMTVNIMSELNEKIRSEFGSTIYDKRSWESISDQFASRMGCTVALATGLEKILRMGEASSFMSGFAFYSLEVIKTILFLGSMGLGIAVGPAGIALNVFILSLMAIVNPHERLYDRPRERIIRMRNEVVLKMKNKDIPVEIRKSLAEDLQVIDHVLEGLTDRETFVEKVWLLVSPSTRRQKKITKELQELESLVNNSLFARANSLKLLEG
ncbi:putative M48 family lipoprotein protease [Serratia phage vB_SmaM_Yaphecito]|uniref:Putative M48 family lipoprotein protease n=1 Tax=Serratia phage vB_SmaM_Yaphecito TaxID=2777368 RepID=A0A7T3TLS5_9CAUD|nr:putative M48 family lipoprotein protease [Serratia phage vB_SmaM_Yaphecito]